MAIKYLRSTDGNDADAGSTWALAKAKASSAATAMAAGDVLYVSQAHAESTPAATTITFPGTVASPNLVICANDGAEPPTAGATGATIATSGGNALTIVGSSLFDDIIFSAGDASNFAHLTLNGGTAATNRQIFKDCAFRLAGSHASSVLSFGGTNGPSNYDTKLINPTFKLSGTGQTISLRGDLRIVGGAFEAGTAAITSIFKIGATAQPGRVFIDGFDASDRASTVKMFAAAAQQNGIVIARGCKMPSGWSAANITGTIGSYVYSRYEMYDTLPSGGDRIPFIIADAGGLITHESTIVVTGGSDVGSVKLASSSICTEFGQALQCFDLSTEITSFGSAKTATVQFVHDSVTDMTNADIYVDLYYPTADGVAMLSSKRASVFDSTATPATSSATWTTTGLTNPNKQKIDLAFTPGAAGLVTAVVRITSASKTVYIDAKMTVA